MPLLAIGSRADSARPGLLTSIWCDLSDFALLCGFLARFFGTPATSPCDSHPDWPPETAQVARVELLNTVLLCSRSLTCAFAFGSAFAFACAFGSAFAFAFAFAFGS